MIKFDAEVERQDDRTIREIKALGLPVVLWGGGEIAGFIKKKLRKHGVEDVHYAVDVADRDDLIAISEVDRRFGAYVVAPAFLRAMEFGDDEFVAFKNAKKVVRIYNMYIDEVEVIDAGYFKEHEKDFMAVYKDLADERSKQSFDA